MKKMISLVLSLMMITCIIPVSASSSVNDRIVEDTVFSEPFVDPDKVGTTYPGEIATYDYYGERTVLREVHYVKKSVVVTPSGQPSLGYVGGSGATVFFFESKGSSVSVSFTVEGKALSITAKTEKTTSSGSGYAAPIPSTSGKYQFNFVKDYVIKVSIIDIYQGIDYKSTFYRTDPEYSLTHKWVKIGN